MFPCHFFYYLIYDAVLRIGENSYNYYYNNYESMNYRTS